jgi:hypothetical protein
MKYVILILTVLTLSSSSLGYWYYRDSQKIIATLQETNAQLETAIKINEETISSLQSSYKQSQEELGRLNEEYTEVRRRNQLLIDKFADNDIGFLAESKPELVERLINRGTVNAFRCVELLSGAELTEEERMPQMAENLIQNVLGSLILLSILSGCAKTPEPPITEISAKPVEKPTISVPGADEVNLRNVEWIVVTPENIDEKFAELEKRGAPVSLFAVTGKGYENLSLNLNDMRSQVEQLNAIIVVYERYYNAQN